MFEDPYNPTKEELFIELKETQFNLSVQNERIIQMYGMIADLSELIEEMSAFTQEAVEDIYNRQYKMEHARRKPKTITRNK